MDDIAVNKALSGIFGSISLTSWICLLLPQLITNYKAKSAEGLSMAFLLVWLFGDIANLSGALVTGIAPTAAALAGYFCVSDLVLITQCLYYNMKNARAAEERAATTALASEDEPLLQQQQQQQRRRRSSSVGLPGSQRRSSVRQHESGFDPIRRIVTGEDETPASHPALANALSVAAVYVVGTLGWFLSYKAGAWDGAADDDGPTDPADANPTQMLGLALGYLSAVCYLCARVPQIIKNYREKSCEGLALLFFLLSLTGNLTYGASVFSYSQEPAYIIKTIPWLLGSLGTIVEDLIIFYQFRIYTPQRAAATKTAVGAAP